MARAVLVPPTVDPSAPAPGSRAHRLDGGTMGTNWSVQFLAPPAAASTSPGDLLDRIASALRAELEAVVGQMSHWEPDSQLARYNRAPAGTWHDLPAQFFDVMAYALDVMGASGGAYDPAAGRLVNLWGFGPARRYDAAGFYAPDEDAIAAALAARSAAHPVLDRARRRLLQPGGAVLDLSSVAKGYAVDRLGACLDTHGIRHWLVEIGGELRGAGMKTDEQPWWVEVESPPDAPEAMGAVVALHGLAIATSGDYRQYFQHARRRVSHTLDPRSGRPIDNGVTSVTVLAPTCMAADAWSTALSVLGPNAGIALADARGLAVRYLGRRSDAGPLSETVSAAWRALLD